MVKTKNIIFIFFAAIIVLIFVAIPRFQSFLEEKYALNAERERLQNEDNYIESLARTIREIQSFPDKIELVDNSLPDDSEIPSTIRYVEETAGNYGLFFRKIDSFSTNPSRNFSQLVEARIVFTMLGDYRDFKRFLRSLEFSSKIIEIESFEISPEASEETGEMLSFRVTIKTYSY